MFPHTVASTSKLPIGLVSTIVVEIFGCVAFVSAYCCIGAKVVDLVW